MHTKTTAARVPFLTFAHATITLRMGTRVTAQAGTRVTALAGTRVTAAAGTRVTR
jgi:hypothetical protein